MKRILPILLLPFISGCYSSEILPSGASDYTVKNRGESFAQAKLDPIARANKYCSDNGLYFMAVLENEIVVKSKFEYQLKFKCLKKQDYESHQLDMEKKQDISQQKPTLVI